ncbi:MAG: MATE family efflux transporter [Chitinophagales bacterium]
MSFTKQQYFASLKQTLQIGLPIMASHLGHVLMGFFDTVQIGGLGAQYIAATGLASTVYWLLTLLGTGVLFVVAPLVSAAFGEKNEAKAIGIFKSSLRLATWISIIFTSLFFFFIYHFEIFGQSQQVNAIASRYLLIVNLTTPAMIFFTAGRQLLEGMGKTMPGMVINIGALLLNILLNDILIYGKLGLPPLGVTGAALATSISRVAMLLAVFVYIYNNRFVLQLFKKHSQAAAATIGYVFPILSMGIPASLQVFSEAAAFSVAHIMSGWLGEIELAAHQIAINLASMTFMAIAGISAAGTVITGFGLGAKNKEQIILSGRTTIALTLLLEIAFLLCFFLFYRQLPFLYTNNAEVVAMASTLILLAVFFQLSDGAQNVAVGLLRGLQDVKVPAILAFTAYWLVMIPACYLLAFKTSLGIKGIWIGFTIGLSTASVILLLRYRYVLHKLKF